MKKIMLSLWLFGICSNVYSANFDSELVVNGGAETGDTFGWISTGIDAVKPDTFSEGFGGYVFTGGTGDASGQTLYQTIDVSNNSADIDSNYLTSTFSIQLQSRSVGSFIDLARVDVSFLDDAGTQLDSFTFIDNINTDLFDWNEFSDSRLIATGTRAIDILLTSTRSNGLSSDGFFDNVSLHISPVPELSTYTLMMMGIGAVVLVARRTRKNIT